MVVNGLSAPRKSLPLAVALSLFALDRAYCQQAGMPALAMALAALSSISGILLWLPVQLMTVRSKRHQRAEPVLTPGPEHDKLPQAHCVMHTHTTAGVAVACLQGGLQQTNFYSAQLHDMVAYHDFEGITIHADEAPRLLASIGDKPAVILRNHGLLAWGRTLPHAFAILWTLQRACEIQLATFSMGPAIALSRAIAQRCTRDSLQFNPDHGAGQDLFDALVRQVDRIDSSYRIPQEPG